jgi:hypothetical protein
LDEGTPKPRLRLESNGLWIHFPFAPEYLAALQTPESLADPVTPEVTPEVMRMLARVEGDMSRLEMMTSLGLRDEKHFREHYQQAGIAAGLIERTLPDKPNSRLQKYRLTARGRAWLAQHPPSAS